MKNREQQRANFALENVRPLQSSEGEKEFVSYAKALPAMIHQNGLGQAMAFCYSKGKANNKPPAHAYMALYQLMQSWLCRAPQPFAGQDELMTAITTCHLQQYQIAQIEAQQFLIWVKKFAVAELAHD
ncbi:type III-B CRISPR module-associated protein Cmr5 [Candidatus Venteria ishoeyi]|uniref:CRISPR type III-B/RAMP module-associated protein Cmr5 n=1 Tax=Candidatus Venteria ishoeyi TaxID=1899563 RepID=A0A1H6F7G7_9GAMM|nr:type III-B CRISPR module-associated protein Cmr5 [Candidatus Venteria ishoeyi]SEH05259.1 CRISPR system Cmr subunit Cmr5 [Candidatus Venteria ishoeyi]